MNRAFALLLFVLPTMLFSNQEIGSGLLQIDVVVKVVSAESEELWSVNLTKYTVCNRSISLNLKGFDGELIATMTPIFIDDEMVTLKASSLVKSVDTDRIIQDSKMELEAKLGEIIVLYPMGNLNNAPNVIMELQITRHNGVDV